MLAAALRGNARHRPFHDLQQRLLYALARHVPGDRGVVGFAADLVDLVDIDDAALGPLDVVVGGLQQLQDDVLNVLAHIACFRERRGVGHGEGHVEDASQRLRKQRLAAAGGPDQKNVGFRELDIRVFPGMIEPLVMIVDGDGEDALRVILTDHIIVKDCADLHRRRHAIARLDEAGFVLLADNVHAEFDAFIADEHGRPGNELADLMLALPAERAVKCVFRIASAHFAHASFIPYSRSFASKKNPQVPAVPSLLPVSPTPPRLTER
jgi:hypothetical protein